MLNPLLKKRNDIKERCFKVGVRTHWNTIACQRIDNKKY